ncbi:MAG: YggS family pyridoxal phosphate-dependent enzyme [Spirochaetota bacterium]
MDDCIAVNLERIRERISRSAQRAGRAEEEITILGVTKFHDAHAVERAYRAGLRRFGENRVQEAVLKYQDSLRESLPGLKLDMIGVLQKNKINKAIPFFDAIQSIDSVQLLAAIINRAGKRARPLELFLELHTGEETKTGFSSLDEMYRAVDLYLEKSGANPNLSADYPLRGLMTMAPFTNDISMQRKSFRTLRQAMEALRSRYGLVELKDLSMGMSMDFEAAVEEGATILRIGTALFGSRAG